MVTGTSENSQLEPKLTTKTTTTMKAKSRGNKNYSCSHSQRMTEERRDRYRYRYRTFKFLKEMFASQQSRLPPRTLLSSDVTVSTL